MDIDAQAFASEWVAAWNAHDLERRRAVKKSRLISYWKRLGMVSDRE